ncbi:hypothetical protein FK529_03050 [Tsukamurella asaccharolytica]|uniref:Uncharacterized protein n=1 Tax=Tsukamurella asaccharolytica TaxID=2592067 RepID=A0A5C5RF03_9ACTN|nr:hypothetical protein [Tsukamurella asaccharolytica]TWS21577.1 hypothetical protein FK529_03050 [Tsukamurella asaccharolytica]
MMKKSPAKRVRDRWVVDRSCFEGSVVMRPTGPSKASRPAVTEVHFPDMTSPCIVVLPLPVRYRRRRTVEGNVVFGADNWWSVLGSSFAFAKYSGNANAQWFGIKFLKNYYDWWDGVTTDFDRLESRDIATEIEAWLELTYPDATGPILAIDQRPEPGR